MRRLKTGIRSEKCVERRFRRCANVTECTTQTYSTPRLYGIAHCYKSVQHVTVLNTVGNCITMVRIIILHFNIIILYYNIILKKVK